VSDRYELVLWNPMFDFGLGKVLSRLKIVFEPEGKGTPMHSHRFLAL
jgi:hypothetical protein